MSTQPNSTGFYKYHVFICINTRDEYMACDDFKSQDMRDYMKQEIKNRDLHGKGKVRVGQAGCLGRCLSGPVIVVYPQGVWYTYVDSGDIDEIIEAHLVNDQIVTRLLIDPAE